MKIHRFGVVKNAQNKSTYMNTIVKSAQTKAGFCCLGGIALEMKRERINKNLIVLIFVFLSKNETK